MTCLHDKSFYGNVVYPTLRNMFVVIVIYHMVANNYSSWQCFHSSKPDIGPVRWSPAYECQAQIDGKWLPDKRPIETAP